MSTPEADLEAWVGRERREQDRIAARPAEILAATFDHPPRPLAAGDPIPAAWHWLYFHEVVRIRDVGHDGHPARGGFLPPVALPRRMWAGNRMRFERPLRVGETVTRTSTVTRAEMKSGASGRLCFVTVRHLLEGESGPATVEEHDIVYREAPRPGAPARAAPAPPDAVAAWRREVKPDPVLLFRFSALTMNSHRIHYDRTFCIEEEGYPGLLVHGPLTMLLLLDLLARSVPGAELRSVSVRATSPLHDVAPIVLEGAPGEQPGTARLWAVGPGPALAMSADVEYSASG